MLFLIGSNALGLPDRALDFAASGSYLSMTSANFGAYDRTKFAVSFWARANPLGGVVMSQHKATGGAAFTVGFAGGVVRAVSYGSVGNNIFTGTATFSTNTYYHFLVHFDPANGTAADRIKVWINGSADTDTDGTRDDTDINTTTEEIRIGGTIAGDNTLTNKYEGLIYQLGFFSGSLPPVAAVYQSGLKDLSYEPGLFSYIHTNTPNITDDSKIATDWTNHGATTQVVLSSTVP